MSHFEQIIFFDSIKEKHPKYFSQKIVLDIGSLDINGSNRDLFKQCLYIGVDIAPGKNVDFICPGHLLELPDNSVDVVISSECFEHDMHYPQTINNIYRMLKPGGLFAFSCATTGRKEHGTYRTSPEDSPLTQQFSEWKDYYKNLTEVDIHQVINIKNSFATFEFSKNNKSHDLYFWGIKNGELVNRQDYSFMCSTRSTESDVLLNEISNLNRKILKDFAKSVRISDWATERNQKAIDLEQALSEKQVELIKISDWAQELRSILAENNSIIKKLESGLEESAKEIARLNELVKITSILIHSVIQAPFKWVVGECYSRLRVNIVSRLPFLRNIKKYLARLVKQNKKKFIIIKNSKKNTKGNRDFIVFGAIDWHFRYQRPQQIAYNLALAGYRVFYFSNHFNDVSDIGYVSEKLDEKLELYQIKLNAKGAPSIYREMPSSEAESQIESGLSKFIYDYEVVSSNAIAQHPFWYKFFIKLPNTIRIYDCMDHHHGFGNVSESILNLEKKLLTNSDLVLVTSDWLFDFSRRYSKNVSIVRNGTDFNFFSKIPDEIFKDHENRKIVGYYGAIADWFDINLVVLLIETYPEYLFVLIGEDTIGAKKYLKKYKNVLLIGEIKYQILGYYLHAFDVCLMPFKVTPLTLATNPVKIYEYLSAGKPVLSIKLPEINQFHGLVMEAENHEEFISLLPIAIEGSKNNHDVERRKNFASTQTWSNRVTELNKAIDEIKFPKISVVVLTYNHLELTKKCLYSLLHKTDYKNLEIIIVDNASTDGTRQFLLDLRQNFKNIELILNEVNLGFAAGNNIGLKRATGDYLVMLNNDTVVTEGWVMTMLRHLQKNPKIGLLGPVTNNIGNEAKVQTYYSNLEEMPQEALKITSQNFGKLYPLNTAAFFCVMMSRQTYEQCGPLSEEYGLGFFEDDDYCRRVQKIGKKIYCAEDVFIHHELSASFNRLSEGARNELFKKNKSIYENKWGPWSHHSHRKNEK